jgi:diguanylate cyclase (GGDEF)-like protein
VLAQSQRHQKKLAILYLDLDQFKHINDTLCHDIGDKLLKEVAERLKNSIRGSDTVSRISGDEFNIMLSDIISVDDAAVISRNILAAFQKPYTVEGHKIHVTSSIGISIYPDDSEDIETLLKYADIAMYHAKEHGRNTYQFYSPAINLSSSERIQMENSLRQAVERNELVLHYQPQADIDTRQVLCAEALVRWKHPEQGMLDPRHFIPLAEETGFITAIDEWVLKAACKQFKEWKEADLLNMCVTVNLSAKQFQKADFVECITEILDETGFEPNRLQLEITESTAMKSTEHTIPNMNRLAELGVGISIDDFGTGYSSLSYLKKLHIQKLKIDKSFIHDIATDPDAMSIISAVTAMAQNMKIRVIAEGVETEQQIEFLKSVGCQEMQGFLFSRPLPAEEFRELIANAY